MRAIGRLSELLGDMSEREVNDHVAVELSSDGGLSAGIDADWLASWGAAAADALDEVESELEGRYMELPVDADGVPVRVGDSCVDKFGNEEFVVSSVEWNGLCWSAWSVPEKRHICTNVVHGSPRTVEDVLHELVDDALGGTGRDPLLKDWKALVCRYAAEIRELLEVEDGR